MGSKNLLLSPRAKTISFKRIVQGLEDESFAQFEVVDTEGRLHTRKHGINNIRSMLKRAGKMLVKSDNTLKYLQTRKQEEASGKLKFSMPLFTCHNPGETSFGDLLLERADSRFQRLEITQRLLGFAAARLTNLTSPM